jgi:CHAT domain-containing protein/tetratricopeptide (TPR) repeat protein
MRTAALLLIATAAAGAARTPAVPAAPSAPSAGAPQTPPPVPPPAEALRPGIATGRDLAPDATLRFTIALAAGAYVDVTVDQLGIDAIVAVTGPDGAAIDDVDDTSETDGPEHVRILATTPGDYTLTVQAEALPTVKAGRAVLTATAPRPPTEAEPEALAERRAGNEQAARLQARYDEIRRTGRHDPAADTQLIDDLDGVARAADAAGRLRQADRARAARAGLLLLMDRNAEVVPLVQRRLTWLKGARYQAARAAALTQLAEASTRLGDTSRAIELFQEALTIPQPPGAEAITRDNLGATLRRVGRLQEALDAHQQALEYFKANGPKRSVAVVLTRLSFVWEQLGDLRRSLELQEEALAVTEDIHDTTGTIRNLANIAGTQRNLGDFAAARRTGERALAAAREHASRFFEGHVSLVLANLDVLEEKFADAVPRATLAATVFHEVEYPIGEAQARMALSKARLGLGQLAEADEAAQAAASLARAAEQPNDEGDALYTGARVAIAAGRLADARDRLERALACVERVRTGLAGTQLRASLTSNNHLVYEDHVDVLMAMHRGQPEAGFDRAAFESSELSRARSLLDVLATSAIDVRAGVDGALLDRERAIRVHLADKDVARRRARDSGDAASAEAIGREIDELARALQVAESQIAESGPAYAALMRPRPLAIDALRHDVLDAETVLLEYAIGDHRGWLFALTPDGLETYEVGGRVAFGPAVRSALQALRARGERDPAPTPAAWREGLAHKHAELVRAPDAPGAQALGPLAARLRGAWQGRRLVIVGSGPLAYVPFAALPVPRLDGQTGPPEPLLAAHEVVMAPSAAVVAAVRRETAGRTPPAKTLAIVADPVFEAGDPRVRRGPALTRTSAAAPVQMVLRGPGATREALTRLPFTRREATAIAALLPPAARTTVTDFAASRAWALSAPLGDYRIVHFATHGIIDAAQPALSSLALSLVDERGTPVDGYLRMYDIYNRRLPVDLVVLSACRTALGQDVYGEGLVGLTRGFLYAGARSVIASLWQVDDVATAELMTRFYRHVFADQATPAAALRAAQLELSRDPRWAAPYFWAGFVIQGDWR